MRLQSFLSQSGVASRRNVLTELEAGKVKVNGDIVRIPSYPIYPDKDEVMYEDKLVKLSEAKTYFMFNKPVGVISTAKDTHGRKTVLDFFNHIKERLYPIGRLDQDTTGLLLVTNDGNLAHKLMHPRFGVKKVYEVVADREIKNEEVEQLKQGVIIEEGIKTAPCEVFVLETQGGKSKVEVVLHEGRKRQIRMMFGSLGMTVIHLHRKKYGPLHLKGLPPGKFRALANDEIEALKEMVDGGNFPIGEGRPQNQNRPPRSSGRPNNPRFNKRRPNHFRKGGPNPRRQSNAPSSSNATEAAPSPESLEKGPEANS